jgi:hypothetical protein
MPVDMERFAQILRMKFAELEGVPNVLENALKTFQTFIRWKKTADIRRPPNWTEENERLFQRMTKDIDAGETNLAAEITSRLPLAAENHIDTAEGLQLDTLVRRPELGHKGRSTYTPSDRIIASLEGRQLIPIRDLQPANDAENLAMKPTIDIAKDNQLLGNVPRVYHKMTPEALRNPAIELPNSEAQFVPTAEGGIVQMPFNVPAPEFHHRTGHELTHTGDAQHGRFGLFTGEADTLPTEDNDIAENSPQGMLNLLESEAAANTGSVWLNQQRAKKDREVKTSLERIIDEAKGSNISYLQDVLRKYEKLPPEQQDEYQKLVLKSKILQQLMAGLDTKSRHEFRDVLPR